MDIQRTQAMTISEIAYELYKVDWVRSHVSAECQRATLLEYFKHQRACAKLGETCESYEEWLFDVGYLGIMHACYEEFCDGEYHDREYIISLFGNDEEFVEFVKLYLDDIKDDYLEAVD